MQPLLSIKDLRISFRSRTSQFAVLEDFDLDLQKGETVCLVGESGSGKTMTGLALMGLVPSPGFISNGAISFEGREMIAAGRNRAAEIRGKNIAMIFQEPMTALNPVFTIGEQIAEMLRYHEGLGRKAAIERAVELLRAVGIPEPEQRVHEYPHQISGGMRQRAMIAVALACSPQILIADEPTTALDVTVQAQILDLLEEVQERLGTTILLITHDMGVVADVADRVVVMYCGRKIEEGPAAEVLADPRHPYTSALLACIPRPDPEATTRMKLLDIPGIVPAASARPAGCAYAARCAFAFDKCRAERPPLFEVAEGRSAACWLASKEHSQ
ncbi:ABC transporter ATP-binding protein [Pseudaminobacter arsenicus]|uniref:ABC transporter ATP-binding protein n=1 Tax=Borborobacter arsenicus TaxID=1851146 RepID=A0A432VBL9_9HYPH|nr:ABC transporter ATP-binding protein [Pseudaminobacter arsenicus]RUM99534.1 ABC transporter ATP-binding protein [Pseudaminobacter arsenicus]